MKKITISDMLKSGVHFGHKTCYWEPRMAPYIFESRNNVHIIDLEKTLPLFRQSLNFMRKTAQKGGKILFVGTKWAANQYIVHHAKRCSMPYVNSRWLGGMLTNFKTIKQSVKRLRELEESLSDGTINQLKKREVLSIKRNLAKLEANLGGVRDMTALPAAIFVVDVGKEKICVKEANLLGIPVIGIVDSNHSPEGIDFVIPGNDDSIRAINYYLTMAADAVIEGVNAQSKSGAQFEDEFEEIEAD